MGAEIRRGKKPSALDELVQRGRRRQASHVLIHSACFGAAIALAGAILLLIVGAQILDWYWLAVLFTAGLGAGAYRLRRRMLSPYRIAQAIDWRLAFNDALSTAYYFHSAQNHPGWRGDFIEAQREQAESLARSVDMRRAMPFMLPRTAYVSAALAAVALGMFGLRYGIRRNLDFGPPLVRVNVEGLFGNSPKIAEARPDHRREADGRRDPRSPEDPWDTQDATDRNPEPDSSLQSAGNPDSNNGNAAPDAASKPDGKNAEQPPEGSPLDSGDKGDSSPSQEASSKQSGGAENKSGQPNGAKDAKDAKDSNPSGSSANSPSLAGKLRDALSNLMAKMKPQTKQGGGKPNDSSQSASSQRSQQGDKQEGDAKSASQEQADASANSKAQSQQQQGGAQQASQGKSEGQSDKQPTSPDGKSGIGKQDGDKAAREAAELAAMGKINEIIGKRAANVTGEMMVEVSSGKQQLKTEYSGRNGTHSDAGGEINRDEVPLAYQQYVQQYFAQMRKLPAAKGGESSRDSKRPNSKAGESKANSAP